MANEIKFIYDTGLTLTATAYYDNAGTITQRGTSGMTEEPESSGHYKATITGLAAGDMVKITESVEGLVGSGEYLPSINTTALLAIVGVTVGGTMTLQKLLKIQAARAAGNWRAKPTDSTVDQLLDPDDGETVILEQTLSQTSPYVTIAVMI